MDTGPTNNDPLIGTTFGGKYHITERIGAGGMGGVYKAEHLLMSRVVAVKFLRSTLLHDEVLLKRFHHEAKAASQISHPNAVTLFDYGVEDGIPYLVMEFIEGRTLKNLIAEEKPLKLERVCKILHQICSALDEAHRVGIVHRDIKPDNFMVRRASNGDDVVKVLDFGVSKSVGLADFGSDQNLTQAGMIIGTPQYISPEQCQGKDLDPRCDIYSLGAVTYEMLTGEVPFKAPTVLELLVRVLHHEAEPIRKFRPELEIPPAIDAVVMKTLEKDRDKRFSSIMEFYRAFEKAAMGDKLKRQKLLTVAGATAAACLLFGAAYFLRPSAPPTSEESKEILKLSEAVARAEKDKATALARAEKLKREAEELMRRNEVDKANALHEQQLAAELLSTQTEDALKRAVDAKSEAERSLAKLKQTAVEREEALKRERESTKKAEQERQEALKQAEALRLEAGKQAEEMRRAEEERARILKEQQQLAAQAEREKQIALEKAASLALEQEEAARKAEQEKAEAVKQAEAAKAELARLSELAKKAEAEKADALKKIEQAKKESSATIGSQSTNADLQAQEAKLAEVIRKANEQKAEALKRAEEMKREAAKQAAAARRAEEDALRMKQEAERRMKEQAAQPPPTPAPQNEPPAEEGPKKRRRCGPTWCL